MTHDAGDYGAEDSDHRSGPQENDAWDTEADVTCPCCGEGVTVGLDPGGGPSQTYVEDCQVCCQPWRVRVNYDDNGVARVWVEAA
ncbi:MAG: CPXCG motif-containing cysteine-rich protein [Gemmatimonadales bacterium]|nr:MAG: CPXCG motif-containing cysteine-rich protein [Gemmatimonadales bacterium]